MFRNNWKRQVVGYYLLKISDNVDVLLDVFSLMGDRYEGCMSSLQVENSHGMLLHSAVCLSNKRANY